MTTSDFRQLAERQHDDDRARTANYPELLERKTARMSSSPFAFLRGSAPLFFSVLAADDDLRAGPEGTGWICGDAHLENFGAYRPDPLSGATHEEARACFHINDFDEAVIAPLRFDVLRLATSVILVARERGASGKQTVGAARSLLDRYVEQLMGTSAMPPTPRVVDKLLDQVRRRSRRSLLDARTALHGRTRRFVRGERYRDIPDALALAAKAAFARYVAALPEADRPSEAQARVVDVAFRVAGTGSLGALRLAILVEGKGDDEGQWIFDMKEEGDPSAACVVGAQPLAPADRVIAGMRASLPYPIALVGAARLEERSMLVRRLRPQEDRLDASLLPVPDLEAVAGYFGALLGEAHRHGATALPPRAWSDAERDALVDSAIRMAVLHEAAWLAYCR